MLHTGGHILKNLRVSIFNSTRFFVAVVHHQYSHRRKNDVSTEMIKRNDGISKDDNHAGLRTGKYVSGTPRPCTESERLRIHARKQLFRRYENKKLLRAEKHPKWTPKRTKEQDITYRNALERILQSA